MTDQVNVPSQGYGKASGPPIAGAITEIFSWVLLTFYKVDVPANIQIDFAMVLATFLVLLVPHDLFSKLANRSK